jgi:hypothetical protein
VLSFGILVNLFSADVAAFEAGSTVTGREYTGFYNAATVAYLVACGLAAGGFTGWMVVTEPAAGPGGCRPVQ